MTGLEVDPESTAAILQRMTIYNKHIEIFYINIIIKFRSVSDVAAANFIRADSPIRSRLATGFPRIDSDA